MRRLLLAADEGRLPPAKGQRLIQYFGLNGSYPRASYYRALKPDKFLPPIFLRQNGYRRACFAGPPEISADSKDAFSTP
ncbi:MAG: hypothetical protein L3J05_09975 [Robiginitomaculum sp.]|nr:hypothetical protein [Robiginitomaculum sp.]